MKKLHDLLFLTIVLGVFQLNAQDFSSPVKKAIGKFDFMIGKWEGVGWAYTSDGVKEHSKIKEDIRHDLDSTIIVIKGKGMSEKDGQKVKTHHALGVLSYDSFRQKITLNSWIHKGMSTVAHVDYKAEGSFVWWFEVEGTMTMRYTVSVENNHWKEIGEMSTDNVNWRQFFEMNLMKVEQ